MVPKLIWIFFSQISLSAAPQPTGDTSFPFGTPVIEGSILMDTNPLKGREIYFEINSCPTVRLIWKK